MVKLSLAKEERARMETGQVTSTLCRWTIVFGDMEVIREAIVERVDREPGARAESRRAAAPA